MSKTNSYTYRPMVGVPSLGRDTHQYYRGTPSAFSRERSISLDATYQTLLNDDYVNADAEALEQRQSGLGDVVVRYLNILGDLLTIAFSYVADCATDKERQMVMGINGPYMYDLERQLEVPESQFEDVRRLNRRRGPVVTHFSGFWELQLLENDDDSIIILNEEEMQAEDFNNYQRFLYLYIKAVFQFGSPSHDLIRQLASLSRIFKLNMQFIFLPGCIQMTHYNPVIGTNETHSIVTCNSMLGYPILGAIYSTALICKRVVNGHTPISDGTAQLRYLLGARPRYGLLIRCLLGSVCSALICGTVFGGSFNDMWLAGLLGLMVTFSVQGDIGDNCASSTQFITAFLCSFISCLLENINEVPFAVCSSSVSFSSIVSLFPIYMIYSGVFHVGSNNIYFGIPKVCSGILTFFYIMLGFSMGHQSYYFFDNESPALTLATSETFSQNILNGCYRDPSWDWYLQPIPDWSYFIFIPLLAIFLSMRFQQHWWNEEMAIMLLVTCFSYAITLPWTNFAFKALFGMIGPALLGFFNSVALDTYAGGASTFVATFAGMILLTLNNIANVTQMFNFFNLGEDKFEFAIQVIVSTLEVSTAVICTCICLHFLTRNVPLVTASRCSSY